MGKIFRISGGIRELKHDTNMICAYSNVYERVVVVKLENSTNNVPAVIVRETMRKYDRF